MATIAEILVPDIGDYSNVEIIEIAISIGDVLEFDAPLITLETDKATVEVPAPFAGTVTEVKVKVGDKVSEGALVALIETTEKIAVVQDTVKPDPEPKMKSAPEPKSAPKSVTTKHIYAGPAVRRLAFELDIDLTSIRGTGEKNRITKDDLKRSLGASASSSTTIATAPVVDIDFSKFGAIETVPLSRIKKISGAHLHRNWVTIPHVTQFDEADITELENFRKNNKTAAEKLGFKLTPLVFILQAVVKALQAFPEFNAALVNNGNDLVLKKYFHIGVAVDTPNGLVVPVIRDVEQKSLLDLAAELAVISVKARDGKLSGKDMQGGCFSISSLGGISGTAFTPIVNAPEVAILGVSRSKLTPQYIDGALAARLMLPLSLSYDHRVIDGAMAAKFSKFLVNQLEDIRRILL